MNKDLYMFLAWLSIIGVVAAFAILMYLFLLIGAIDLFTYLETLLRTSSN